MLAGIARLKGTEAEATFTRPLTNCNTNFKKSVANR